MQILLLTALTVVAFAANSVLCRMALGDGAIDPASFTTVRLATGALGLWLLLRTREPVVPPRPDLLSASFLFIYAICFSFAYISLAAGTGALILFGEVQITMIGYGLIQAERPHWLTWLGIVVASGGLIYLVLPGVTAPVPLGKGARHGKRTAPCQPNWLATAAVLRLSVNARERISPPWVKRCPDRV